MTYDGTPASPEFMKDVWLIIALVVVVSVIMIAGKKR